MVAKGPGPGYGWWSSPWSAAAVAAGKVGRSGLQRDDHGVIWWTETRPELGGRQVVVRAEHGGTPVDVSPEGVSVRSRVHEYGGAAATVSNAALFYVDQADQRWYRTGAAGADAGTLPMALTPGRPESVESLRYADGRVTPSGDWLISVEERVATDGTTHRLVAVSTAGSQEVVTLSDESDFVAAPRPSPDGTRLAWVSWDHPSMPWDSSEVRLATVYEEGGRIRLGPGHTVAGGDGCSVGQPRWCGDGSLVFVDDRNGWWLPYRLIPDRPASRPLWWTSGPSSTLPTGLSASRPSTSSPTAPWSAGCTRTAGTSWSACSRPDPTAPLHGRSSSSTSRA